MTARYGREKKCGDQPVNIAIRKMKESDFDSLHTLLSDAEVMKYLEPPFTEEQTGKFLAQALSETPRVLAAEHDGRFIGYVIYGPYEEDTMELGWVLQPEYWNRGYASALTEMLMEKAAAEGRKPVIECDPGQAVTRHIAEKYGFRYIEARGDLEVYRLPEQEDQKH